MGNIASITEGALSLRRVVLLLTTMGVALLLASGVAHAAAPANDNFANAQQITGANATLSGTNVDATKESGEPNHANTPGGKSVWYNWTPQGSGETTIDTAGSTFDTLLAVYTGSAVNGLSEVASNDDENDLSGLGILTSKVSFTATAGTTYRIAVDGFNNGPGAESGSITLNLASDTPDITAPTVIRVAPQESATDIARAANVSAVFSEAMRAASVKSSFKLYKKGSDTPIEATVSYDADKKRAVLDPDVSLQRGATYRAVVGVSARDLAGNALDQNSTLTGNQPKEWVFKIARAKQCKGPCDGKN